MIEARTWSYHDNDNENDNDDDDDDNNDDDDDEDRQEQGTEYISCITVRGDLGFSGQKYFSELYLCSEREIVAEREIMRRYNTENKIH